MRDDRDGLSPSRGILFGLVVIIPFWIIVLYSVRLVLQ